MPHNKSAAKRLRKNETRRLANKSRMSELKSLKKGVERAIHDGQVEQAKTLYRTFSKKVDQAASISTIHKNQASRLKSRMALAIAKPPVAKSGKPAAG